LHGRADWSRDQFETFQAIVSPKTKLLPYQKALALRVDSLFRNTGQEVPPVLKTLSADYTPYLLSYGFDAKPEGGDKFRRVSLKLVFVASNQFTTYDLSPNTTLEKTFSATTDARLGVNAELKFAAVLPVPPIVKAGADVDAGLKTTAQVNWEYSLLRAKVLATGFQSDFAEWDIKDPKRTIGTVPLGVILLAPKKAKRLHVAVSGSYALDRGILLWNRPTQVKFASTQNLLVRLPAGSAEAPPD